jgi:uncharacterized repeat protein (TIGR03803 family)
VQTADGVFFGALAYGGPGGRGGLYRMTAAGEVTMIHGFSGPDGASPFSALLVGSDSRLYGTTLQGGPLNHGTVFGVDPDGGDFVSLHAFHGTDGSDPRDGLIELADGFYGTASISTAEGTAFQVDRSGTFTTLHSFGTPGDGRNPWGALVALDENTLLGTTVIGGAFSQGTIFRLSRQRSRAVEAR